MKVFSSPTAHSNDPTDIVLLAKKVGAKTAAAVMAIAQKYFGNAVSVPPLAWYLLEEMEAPGELG